MVEQTMEKTNPLQKYFRKPVIHIRLPSEGRYYPENAVEIPPNGEFPVYPMTAMDEITYRTADALFNGSAVASVIESCVPGIKDAWSMPAMDLDTVIIAIRIASYGHSLEFDSRCPKCEEENTFAVDLRSILENISAPDYEKTVSVGDIELFFKPLTYKQQNANTMEQFQDQKLLQTVPDADMNEEEKIRLLNQAFVKLGNMTIRAISKSISMIKAEDNIVSEPEYIEDFVKNCDRTIFESIREHITEIKQQSELQPLEIACSHCGHEYTTPFTLDQSNFFGSRS